MSGRSAVAKSAHRPYVAGLTLWEQKFEDSSALHNDLIALVGELRSSPTPACRRLGFELKRILDECLTANPAQCALAAPVGKGSLLLEWIARLPGPPDTPYDGGVFRLLVRFPEAYPLKPPAVQFLTPCFHPNISINDGKVCLNVLKQEWNPLLTVSSLLLCLSALLSLPAAEDPLNVEAAEAFRENEAAFAATARAWTSRYARVS